MTTWLSVWRMGWSQNGGYAGVKIIPVSELEANTDKYIEISQKQDVFITENGEIVAKLTAYTE